MAPKEWYDQAFRGVAHEESHRHFTRSQYYFLWTVIADRIPLTASVLEIGCGPGQFASLLESRGVAKYVGFDFSRVAVEIAREQSPRLRFVEADAFTTDLLVSVDYDTVVCTEVLEHVADDLGVVRRIRAGTRCLMSVPNFDFDSHVRHFRHVDEVTERYSGVLEKLAVTWWPMTENQRGFFLLDGYR